MKKKILFSLIGAVIIFLWQFISFALVNFHQSSMQYTKAQEEILQAMENSGLQEGMYLLGQPDPSLSSDAKKQEYKQYEGKPFAIINYRKSMSMDMAMPMFRGFLVAFVISWLLFWIFLQQKDPSLKNRVILALSVGLIGFFFTPYTNFIWYKNPDIFAYFADGIVPWIILGFIGHKMAR